MLPAVDSQRILRSALESSLRDQAVNRIDEALPSPARLTPIEKSAWLQLQNWGADEVLRKDFQAHAIYSRRRLEHLLRALDDA